MYEAEHIFVNNEAVSSEGETYSHFFSQQLIKLLCELPFNP